MSTSRLETFIPKAGVNKPKSKMGLAWDKLTKPVEEPPYHPLPEYYIRVAKIKPGTKDHPLRVKLKHIDPRTTKYVALSYTWDQDQSPLTTTHTNSSSDSQSTLPGTAALDSEKPKTTTILCGGTPFRVRQNLYDALCQIRDIQCDLPIFVDALCINFNDNAERSSYLEIIGHVYSRAASVIVYLGPKSPRADSTMRTMRQLVNAINWRRIPNPNDPSSTAPSTYNFHDPRFFQTLGMEPLTLKQWRAIYDFCQMRWFSRYWSFFELALAKNALFLWGEACMEYNFLLDFSMILSLSGWLDQLGQISTENLSSSTFESGAEVGLIKMLVPIAHVRSSPPWSPKHNDYATYMRATHGLDSEVAQAWQFFEILLQSAEPFDCYNPRDKVYAPLAMARAVFAGTPMNKLWPKPDYQKDVADIYAEFAGLIARETGRQSIIVGMDGYVGPPVRAGAPSRGESRNGAPDRSQNTSQDRSGMGSRGASMNRNMNGPELGNSVRSKPVSRNGTISEHGSRAVSRNGNGNGSGAPQVIINGNGTGSWEQNVLQMRTQNRFSQSQPPPQPQAQSQPQPPPKSQPQSQSPSKLKPKPTTRNGKLVSKRWSSKGGRGQA